MDTTITPYVLNPEGVDITGEAAKLRARGDLTVVELPGAVTAWSITHPDLARLLLNHPMVSKNPRHWPAFVNGEIGPDWPLWLWVAVNNMFTADGAEHRRLRKLLSPAFTRERIAALRPRIEAITADLLDDLATTPTGEPADVRERFAYPLPIRVIAELMGVPEHLGKDLRAAVDGLFATDLTAEDAATSHTLMYTVLSELVAYRRRHPGAEDLTRLLIGYTDPDDQQLDEQQLLDTLLMVISAGHETTVNLLDQAILALLHNPEQYAAVRTGQADWSDVIEEALRFRPPVAHVPLRYAVDDIHLDGTTIERGDPILISYAALALDPVYGENPDQFDLTRKNLAHLSFGYGPHLCLGVGLARLEAAVALPALFQRFPTMRLAVTPQELGTIPSFISNGHRALPLHLT
ncbi:cytochrome P450 [Nocardia sp. NPDC050435]|uniref:cytochrome P450 family protein n=1 Tax=Nocardia sp. NPDC050435 TaxID=3155040 RepID=UPI0033E39E1F